MSTVSPSIRDLARRLAALEAARVEAVAANEIDAIRVCERLRLPLSKLAGVAGFRSLISRALAMAKMEIPSLASVHVLEDGSLEYRDRQGWDRDNATGSPAGVVVLTHLLGLLVTFIGEPLTLQLVRDAWPNASVTIVESGSEQAL